MNDLEKQLIKDFIIKNTVKDNYPKEKCYIMENKFCEEILKQKTKFCAFV